MLALRGQIDDGQLGAPFSGTGLPQRRQAAQQRLGQHHHAGPTAIGAVIDAPIIVEGVVARVPAAQEIRVVARAPDHAIGCRGLDQVGKDGDDLEVHGNERASGDETAFPFATHGGVSQQRSGHARDQRQSAAQSAWMRRAAMSTD